MLNSIPGWNAPQFPSGKPPLNGGPVAYEPRCGSLSTENNARRNGRPSRLVLLVMPPQRWLLDGFSSGLISIANHAQRRSPGWTFRLVDFSRVSLTNIRKELAASVDPAASNVLVCITTTTATYFGALAVAQAAKEIDRNWTVVLGGHHATPEDTVVLEAHPRDVDIVVRGEGERALAGILASFPKWHATPGLTYRVGGRLVRTADAPSLTPLELDDLPPFLEGAETGLPLGRCDRVTYVSARGCPLGCAFCAVAQETIRAKTIPAVIRDLDILVRQHGFMRIGIEDNFFAQAKRRTLALCKAISVFRRKTPGARFHWDCQTRVESLSDPSVIRAMAEAGCDGVYLGVESFHPDILLALNKTRAPERYLDLLGNRVVPEILDAGIGCYLNLQFGTPEETEAHRQRDVSVLRRLGALASHSGAKIVVCPMLSVVYPGTMSFRQGVTAGAWPRGIFEPFVEWEAVNEPVRRWLGRHFAHGTGGIPSGILRPEELRRGKFQPDADRILALDNHLRDLRSIEGIEIFSYEPHLVDTSGPRRIVYAPDSTTGR